ncbi:hypothetical protein [Aliikangiella maris]|uniref:Uncharacterized protein n=2 Tax=Aliikangiella maris TaxID=3162458 RepID=A0ABV3MV88_9GAMM
MVLIFKRLVFVLLLAVFSCTAEPVKITREKATKLAKKKIKKAEIPLKFDSELLPPMEVNKTSEGFEFEVIDVKQNIKLMVFVSSNGATDLSSISLTELDRRRNEAKKKSSQLEN